MTDDMWHAWTAGFTWCGGEDATDVHREAFNSWIENYEREVNEGPMQPVMVRMPANLYAEVKHLAEQNDRTISWIIRQAVSQHIRDVP